MDEEKLYLEDGELAHNCTMFLLPRYLLSQFP